VIEKVELHVLVDETILAVRGGSGRYSEAGPVADAVHVWLTARLSEAPPLSPEQLRRLQQLLGTDEAAALRSA
jgi:hypothetical protein